MAKDPYKYFRIEARELLDGLSQGVIALEKSGSSRELVSGLLRLAHTLKGAARVVKQKEVAESAHRFEELLEPFREVSGPLPRDTITQLLEVVDDCGERLKPLLAAPEQQRTPATVPQEMEGTYSNVRVEIADIDELLFDLADAGTHLAALHQETATFERAVDRATTLVNELGLLSAKLADSSTGPGITQLRAVAEELRAALKQSGRSIRAGLERAHRDVSSIRDRTGDLRLLPAKSIFGALERTARDAAETLKKVVRFEAAGGEHRLDANVLLALRDALAHVVRNAVAHGIETESKRKAAGKSAEGHVRLQVHKKGPRIHFVVDDDGGGLDLNAIRESLIAKDVIDPIVAMSLELPEAIQLLFEGGISTASEVTEVMGRGIGLDVVRSTVTKLKGEVNLHSQPGQSTTVDIKVPVSMESMDVLAVMAGDVKALIPFDAVRQTVRLASKDLARSASGTMLALDGQALPFLPLAELLGKKRHMASAPRMWTTLVIQSRGQQAAVGVDRLSGVRNVVVRPLPVLAGSIPLVTGATLDGEGNPELVLDPVTLVAAVRSEIAPAAEPAAVPPSSVLVVDDSLTSRMLEQSILETAGYQVDAATSGEEALEKVRHKRYAAFVVDVEMPGMNGFELLEKFRADPLLQRIPAILITSRVSPADRQRGLQVGARAHIAKNEFEEGNLLRVIRSLIEEGSA